MKFFIFVGSFLSTLMFSWFTHSQGVDSLKSADQLMRESMITMSRHLGVTCTACHDQTNFKSAKKSEYTVAKSHMKITQLLIDNGFDGKERRPKADCFMCHRGKMKPDFREQIDPLINEGPQKETLQKTKKP